MLRDFLNMGGYGPYVWSCYLLTVVVLAGIGLRSSRQLRQEVVSARRRAQVAAGKSAPAAEQS